MTTHAGTVYLRTRPAPYGEVTGDISLEGSWVHVTDGPRDRTFPASEVLAIEWAEGRDMSE
jgi:hypothetical protein